MELDDLKWGWKRYAERIQLPARDIRSIICNKETGPVTELKYRFRKGMILVPVIIAIALSRLPHHHGLTFNILFCFLLVFALSMAGYFYYNYKLVSRLQEMDVSVKEHLQKQVNVLEKGIRFRLIFTRSMAILFMTIIEALMYWGKEFSQWQSQLIITRLAVYAVAFAAFYLLTHIAVNRRYSRNINRLKALVNELE